MLYAGARLGDRYVLHEPIARGGMGEVWRADDTLLGRVVAVKVLLAELAGDAEFMERFRIEARAMAALSDPNIVEVYDYGQANGLAYLVMQLVPGESLHQVLRRSGPLPPHQVMQFVAQAGRALHHAHSQGIVHRDVKPGNLLVRPDGRLVLTDFGIARSNTVHHLTGTGEVLGTPSYLAPEQVTGAPVGPATDVYALGVVAYECLTLMPPFVGDTPISIALMHVNNEPPPLPPAVPEAVRNVVMRALAKDPRQRWASAGAMAQAAAAAAAANPGSLPVRIPPSRIPTDPNPTRTSGRILVQPPTPARTSGRLNLAQVPTPPLSVRPVHRTVQRRRRPSRLPSRQVAWVAFSLVVLLSLVGWISFKTLPWITDAEANPHTGSSTGTSANPSLGSTNPSASTSGQPSPSPTPTPSETTTAPSANTPGPVVTTTVVVVQPPQQPPTSSAPPTTSAPPRTPGPNERLVPDVVGKYEMEAYYVLGSVQLQTQTTYKITNNTCRIVSQVPAANSIANVNSTVTVTVDGPDPSCQPL